MKLADALSGVHRLFLDTAPVIYYVENVSPHRALMDALVQRCQGGTLRFVTSPITLAECLVLPLRRGNRPLAESFQRVITRGAATEYAGIDRVAELAAGLRATLNLTLTDAFQAACATTAGCEAFLTNDHDLKRVSGLRVLVLDELEL
ncbi:MAG: type II toxin-antitoxin system VapC family toxin [Deltaproteobacteria bacterium]|nr:type II toxin-antitoxin system VapC family toxin [Deltaproteobacteria bacterium]